MNSPRVLLILPCYNEAGTIGQLLDEIAALDCNYHTLVVDDGSIDNTFEVAYAKSLCVRLVCNLGIGGAVQTGIKYAASHNYDFCVQIDGDGQHPPNQVDRLFEAYSRSQANIVVGSRYMQNDTFRSSFARRTGSRFVAQSLTKLFRGAQITDPTSGMRLMDRKAMALFARHYPYDFPEPISLAWAMRVGLVVSETPVEMRAREHGNSSIKGLKTLAYMIRVIGDIILARLKLHALK
jgi:glycosyltransferase involved in cell wall biosynthesis